MTVWPFQDLPNVAVIINREIVSGEDWIGYVSHDSFDGAWQFHTSGPSPRADDAVLVSLHSVVQLDQSITELADLPPGWHAWRSSKQSSWQRAKTT